MLKKRREATPYYATCLSHEMYVNSIMNRIGKHSRLPHVARGCFIPSNAFSLIETLRLSTDVLFSFLFFIHFFPGNSRKNLIMGGCFLSSLAFVSMLTP